MNHEGLGGFKFAMCADVWFRATDEVVLTSWPSANDDSGRFRATQGVSTPLRTSLTHRPRTLVGACFWPLDKVDVYGAMVAKLIPKIKPKVNIPPS